MEKYFPNGEFPKGITQLEVEMLSFGRGGTEDLGGPNKEYHARQVIAIGYPWVDRHMNDWLEMIIWAWCNYEEIGATGCMASGKSYGFSLMCWLEWASSPLRSACVLSSTTKAALKSRIWTHMKKFRSGLVVNGRASQHPAHLIDSQTQMQAVKGDDMHSMSCVAVEGGRLEQAWGSLIGRHPERMICFADEGEQCPEAIFSSRFNMRGGTSFYRFCTAANAVNPASAYGQFIQPKGGWSSARDTDEYWETSTGVCLHFDAFKSPNVIAGKKLIPGLVLQQDIDALRAGKGEDSMEWWAQIRGFPPMSGVRNTVLSWAHITSGNATDTVVWQGEKRCIGALDPAHVSDGDNCVLRFAWVGARADGKQTLGLEPLIYIKLVTSTGIAEDYQVALRVKEECMARGVKACDFGMDATSASGTASIIEQIWEPGIKRINFGAAATTRLMPGDKKTAKERCTQRVEELWFAFAVLVKSDQVRGLDSKSAEQLCTRKYRLAGERYVLQPKSKAGKGFEKGMKQETGRGSPDEADCTVILGDIFRDICGVDEDGKGSNDADAWAKKAEQYQLIASYSG